MRLTRSSAVTLGIGLLAAAAIAPPALARTEAGGWQQVPHDGPTIELWPEAVWSDGTDVWTGGMSIVEYETRPSVKRCVQAVCAASEIPLPPELDGRIDAIDGASPTDIWAVGSQHVREWPGSYDATLTAHFDGIAWTIIPTPPGEDLYDYYLRAVHVVAADDVWAVGTESYSDEMGGGGYSLGYAMHWDGTSWTTVSVTRDITCVESWFTGVTVTTDGTVLIPGICLNESGRGYGYVVTPGATGGFDTVFDLSHVRLETELNAIVAVGADVWVVGRQYASWPKSGTRAISYRLTDGAWSKVTVPRRASALLAVTGTEDGQLWAAGWHRNSAADHRRAVTHWTGERWVLERVAGTGELHGATIDSSGTPWAVGYDYDVPIILRRVAPPDGP